MKELNLFDDFCADVTEELKYLVNDRERSRKRDEAERELFAEELFYRQWQR